MRAWREANPDRVAELGRSWIENNRERAAASRAGWHAANKEKMAELHKEWRQANRELFRGYQQAWREANREEERQSAKARYAANPEKYLARSKAWHDANPSRTAEIWRRRRLRESGNGVYQVSDQELDRLAARQRGLCAYCPEPLDATKELDHIIPVARGGRHSIGNLAWACRRCNRTKAARLLADFRMRCIQTNGFISGGSVHTYNC